MFLKTLNKVFFKTYVGILNIILNFIYVLIFILIAKGGPLINLFPLSIYIIISNSFMLMPTIICLIKKTSFVQKSLIIKKSKINNFIPILYFFIINIICYFLIILIMILINMNDEKIIKSFFKSVNWFELLFSLMIMNVLCLLIGQLLFLYISNIKIIQLVGFLLWIVSLFLSGIFLPSKILKETKIIKDLYLINPFTYLTNLIINSWTSYGDEIINIRKSGIFDFDKDFVIMNTSSKTEYIVFEDNTKIYNLLIPILCILLILPFTFFKKIELLFNSKNIFFNNFKRNKIINKKSNKLIEIKNLEKTFKKQIIFKNLSFSINKNDVIGIIGENGVGKTTLFKTIVGLGNADNGTINYNFNYKQVPTEKMNFLLQESKYIEEFKVKDILDICVDKTTDLIYLNKLKKLLKIEKILNKKTKILSGGEKQRLSLLISILDKPEILFLDEFTTNLDIKAKFEILYYLKKYFENSNMACVLITHDINILQKFCNKIILLKDKQVQTIPKDKIKIEQILKFFN